jgi:hypothetical protein
MPFAVFRRVQEETFTFTPEGDDAPITILSGRLREWLHENVPDRAISLTFPEGDTEERIIERHGLEAPRMASMTEEEANEPVIVGIFPPTPGYPHISHILIDGGHRRWFWFKRGVNTLKGWAVPEQVWSQFLFNDADFIAAVHHEDGSLLPQRRKVK